MIDLSVLRAQLAQVKEEAERSRLFSKSITDRLAGADGALDIIERTYAEQEQKQS